MMRYLFASVMLVHGLIHIMGFIKAFKSTSIKQLTVTISKPVGIIWITVAILFVLSIGVYLLRKEWWPVITIIAVLLSQVVVVMSWSDAKFATIINVIIFIPAFLTWTSQRFEYSYRRDVLENLRESSPSKVEIVTEKDLAHLPGPVQKYLRYVGVVNKSKVKNMFVVFEGQMRDKGKEYFSFTSEQYNFHTDPTRLFFMKGKMFGVTVPGYHTYAHGVAIMDIRFFGLFSIVKNEGEIMNKTETVTLFNDMCLLAPATLIDKRIQWEAIDDNSVRATFTNQNVSISATLFINDSGQLTDFLSNDRTYVTEMKPYPFSTPVVEYDTTNGFRLIRRGDAVWHLPDGKFTYGKFTLKDIAYNVDQPGW
jgi:hypothetical protein